MRVVGDDCKRRARHLIDQRADAPLHHGVEQLIARLEVVMHHRCRHPSFAGDGSKRGRPNAVARKQGDGDVEQAVTEAVLRYAILATGAARAARSRFGGCHAANINCLIN